MKQETGNFFSLSGNEKRINKLINSLESGVLLLGPKSEILSGNEAALKILGLTRNELNGKLSFLSEWDAIHEDGSPFPEPTHPVSTVIDTKKPLTNIIMGVQRLVTNDRIWLLVNAEPLLDDEGEIIEVICSFSDITKHKAVEEKLTWLYQSLEIKAFELATSNTELERFVYVATHDLQEPLRMVSSFTQLLKKKYGQQLDEQANEYINYAVDGATRLKRLILDLLEYSKFSSNREEFTHTDMNAVLQDVTTMFSHELEKTDTELFISELPFIYAKTSLMKQLLENLIGNALKYRSTIKPVIKINYKEEENNYLFSVCDNGIGIDPKYSDKIFILFERLHNGNGTYEGTGVGLAICKKIVEMHRGTIWVESEQEKGSTFYFTISKAQNQTHEKL